MSTRVNFNKNLRMDLACSNDDLRPVMQNIYFKDGYAYASNGYILVKNKLEECGDLLEEQIQLLDDKMLHKDHYKSILKYDAIIVSEDGIEARKGLGKAFFYFNDTGDKFPDAEKALQICLNSENAKEHIFAFKLKWFDIIKKSLADAENCKFRLKGRFPNFSFLVENINESSSTALIMGIELRDNDN